MIEVVIRGFGAGGDQVFRAETESEMIDKLREAQRHATKKIREQAQLIATLRGMLTNSLTSLITSEIAKK